MVANYIAQLRDAVQPHVREPWNCSETCDMLEFSITAERHDRAVYRRTVSHNMAQALEAMAAALRRVGWCSVALSVGRTAHCFVLVAEDGRADEFFTLNGDVSVFIAHSFRELHGLQIEPFVPTQMLALDAAQRDNHSDTWNALWGTDYRHVTGQLFVAVTEYVPPHQRGEAAAEQGDV